MKIKLLGTPAVTTSDGREGPVRGLQSWTVLARVLLSDRPVSRRKLAVELFPDTVDPLGALRWCLASLRRALGPETMTGDPVVPNLPVGCQIDATALEETGFDPLLVGELLENSAPEASSTDFETWLLIERARLSARIDARLRRDTLTAPVEGRTLLRKGRGRDGEDQSESCDGFRNNSSQTYPFCFLGISSWARDDVPVTLQSMRGEKN